MKYRGKTMNKNIELITKHKEEIKNAITYMAQKIWTDDKFINYELYINDNEDIYIKISNKTATQSTTHRPARTYHRLFSYAENITWLKHTIANTLTDREMYEIIDKYNHNIRLIVEGYSNLLTISILDALRLYKETISDYKENTTEITNAISKQILKTFSHKFTKNNFEKIWNIIIKQL